MSPLSESTEESTLWGFRIFSTELREHGWCGRSCCRPAEVPRSGSSMLIGRVLQSRSMQTPSNRQTMSMSVAQASGQRVLDRS